jgi:hypothetical protein
VVVPLTAYALQSLAHRFPRAVENTYTRGLYPYVARTLSFFSRWVTFSLAEILVFLGVLLAVGLLGYRAATLFRKKKSWTVIFSHDAPRLCIALGVAFHLFLLLWGFNYARVSAYENFGISRQKGSADELERVCRELVEAANDNRRQCTVEADDERGSRLPMTRAEMTRLLDEAYRTIPELNYIASGTFAPAKPVLMSEQMSKARIGGVFSPVTNEPNYNANQPDCEIPFTVAHEMAHQRGFAFEDEANFIAFLVCTRANHPYLRYSGYLMAARYCLSDLAEDQNRLDAVRKLVSPEQRQDWRAISKFWARYQGTISRVSQSVNNAYLKANHVESGTLSYSQVVDLIVGWRRKK